MLFILDEFCRNCRANHKNLQQGAIESKVAGEVGFEEPFRQLEALTQVTL